MHKFIPDKNSILLKDVYADSKLSAGSKLLYRKILCISKKKKKVYATDSELSRLIELTPRSVQRMLKQLEEAGYLEREMEIFHITTREKFIYKTERRKIILKLYKE